MPKRVEKEEEVGQPVPAEAVAGTTATTEKSGAVKKLILTEKVKKYLGDIDKAIPEKIHEIVERVVVDDEKNKNNCCFIVFSDDTEKDAVNDEVNVATIKDVLFAYHTAPNTANTGKAMVMEVLPPDEEGEAHLLVMQEV